MIIILKSLKFIRLMYHLDIPLQNTGPYIKQTIPGTRKNASTPSYYRPNGEHKQSTHGIVTRVINLSIIRRSAARRWSLDAHFSL